MRIPALAILALSLLGGCASTPPLTPAQQADALLQCYTGAVPGASLLVVKDGRAVISRGYGMADL